MVSTLSFNFQSGLIGPPSRLIHASNNAEGKAGFFIVRGTSENPGHSSLLTNGQEPQKTSCGELKESRGGCGASLEMYEVGVVCMCVCVRVCIVSVCIV